MILKREMVPNSYTANNDADAVQGLKADEFGTDFFIVSAQDSENFITVKVLGFAVSGVLKKLGLTAPTIDTSLTEGAMRYNSFSGTLTSRRVIAEATGTFEIEDVVASGTLQ